MTEPTRTGDTPNQLLISAYSELEKQLRAGAPSDAAALLSRHPALAPDKTAAMALLYTEFVLREELGQKQAPEEYFSRYPHWADDLRALFEVNAHAQAAGDDPDRTLTSDSAQDLGVKASRPGSGRRIGAYE